MSKIILQPTFKRGLREISNYRNSNARYNPVVTERLTNGILKAVLDLGYMPNRNPKVGDSEMRKALFCDKSSGAKYSIFYSYDKDKDTVHVQDVSDGVTQRASVLLGYSVNEDDATTSPTANYSSAFLDQMQGLTPKAASDSGTSSVKKSENVNE